VLGANGSIGIALPLALNVVELYTVPVKLFAVDNSTRYTVFIGFSGTILPHVTSMLVLVTTPKFAAVDVLTNVDFHKPCTFTVELIPSQFVVINLP